MSCAQPYNKNLSEHSSLKTNPKIMKHIPTDRHFYGEHIPADKIILRLQM